ncbi:MAG TPA: hypothetical protein VME44_13715 [Streptosporangiaceae bacterium]|nr:hypothetical protein [Streptosporangiaceae bacterium]
MTSFPTDEGPVVDRGGLRDQLVAHMNEMDSAGWELVSGTEVNRVVQGRAPVAWARMFWRRPRGWSG